MAKEDKKKHRDKSKSEQKQKKKNKKKNKDERNKSREGKKKKSEKRNYSSSQSDSSNSSQSRSRQKQREKQKKKKKNKEKQQKPTVNIPFPIAQATTIPVMINPLNNIRPGSNIIIPPPAVAPPVAPTSKPKTKQYHIFKLLPKLPFGCVTIGRTIYSSKLFSQGFQAKLITEMCEQLEKSSKLEGSKKMANTINKVKTQIINIENKKNEQKNDNVDLRYQNQFSILKEGYQKQMNSVMSDYLNWKQKKSV